MTTPSELEAAVERVAAWLNDRSFHGDDSEPNIRIGDVRGMTAALAEANERASLLQTAVHERCAERDEARKAIELLKYEVVAAIRDHRSTLVRAEAAEAENVKLREILAPVAALHGLKPPHVVIGRTVREAFFALNPQQEGSRDHG